jgi:glycosyltransferase involved in cell wall biosynthesis
VNPTPKLSIVMPVRNEIQALPGLLQSLLNQEFDSFEIIVADGGSTDGTRQFVTNLAESSRVPLILVDNTKIRSGPGRNAGLRRASGEFIVFLDGHCSLPSRFLLRDTVALFNDTGADCLCRPQPLIAPPKSRTGEVIANVRASTLGHGRDSLIYNMNFSGFVDPASSGASYRREVFSVLAPYDEAFDACEDVEFNTRLRKRGMTAYTDPRVAVYYEPRSTLRALAKQMSNYGRGRVRLALKHPDSMSLGQAAPLGLCVLATATLFSLPFHSLIRTILLSVSACYLILVLVASLQLARKHSLRYLWQGPLTYLTIHFGLGFGMLKEMFSHRMSLHLRRLFNRRPEICS